MKRNLVVLSTAAAFILMSSMALAGPGVIMRVHVPFDFYAGDQMLQAGTYTFEMGSGDSVVKIRSRQNPGMILLTVPGCSGATSDQLQFNQYGEKYFLNAVAIRGLEATFRTHKLEKELRAQMQQARSTILVARK